MGALIGAECTATLRCRQPPRPRVLSEASLEVARAVLGTQYGTLGSLSGCNFRRRSLRVARPARPEDRARSGLNCRAPRICRRVGDQKARSGAFATVIGKRQTATIGFARAQGGANRTAVDGERSKGAMGRRAVPCGEM